MKPYTLDEAEAEMRAALDSGDPERIAAATALVDALDEATQAVPLLSAALWYAGLGIPVFALQPGRKMPFKGSRGFHDATCDPEQITDWWVATPGANIGLATGHSFDVVDVDGPVGQKSRAEHWEDIFAKIDADSIAKVLTPRPGGMHIYVPATGQPNSANIVPSVDYRGIGGYVLAPPSVITAGTTDSPGTYRFLGTPRLTTTDEVA